MKVKVEGKATVDIQIEGMDAREAHMLLRELDRLRSIMPDEFPQSVQMFMDALHKGLSYMRQGERLHYDEEL